jgi:hypothetical protein
MYNFFITMLSLLNQEIDAQKSMFGFWHTQMNLLNQQITENGGGKVPQTLGKFCTGCDKKAANLRCTVYRNPLKLGWFRHQEQCAMNFVPAETAVRRVNALKASKRAALGR